MPLTGSRRSGAPVRPARDDSGAVAVLVAILISAVLLTVGALTVDLGSAWAERAGLRAVAESAALAAAARLPEDPTRTPDEGAVVDAAVRVLCDEANRRPQWGDTTAACITGAATWAVGSDLSDGGVTLERSAEYPTVDRDRAPWVVQVVTPPVRVDFGLARAGGIDHVDVSTSAGARRGLPYSPDSPIALQEPGTLWAGSPYSPYYLTVKDLEDNHGVSFGRLCLRTLPRTNATSFPPTPTPTPRFTVGAWALDGSGSAVDKDTDGNGSPNLPSSNAESFTLVNAAFGVPGPVAVPKEQVSVYVGVGDAAHLATTEDVTQTAPGLWSIRFRTPDLRATPLFGPVPVWWVFDDGTTRGTSTTDRRLDYPAPTGSASGDCDTLGTGRGVVDAEALDPADRSGEAVGSGLLTRLVPYGSRPRAQLLPDRDESCDAPAVAGEPIPAVAGDPAPDGANCVFVRAGADLTAADLTRAWLSTDPDAPGRLRFPCGSQVGSVSGLGSGFDQTDLFSSTSVGDDLLTPQVDRFALRARIRAGLAPTPALREQILPKVLECPRLLLVPVLDATPPVDVAQRHAVVGFTYFWVSDVRSRTFSGRPLRGLMTTSSLQVVGIRGWAVDPGYVRGGDWVAHQEDPDDALPMSVPRASVLVRTECDGHPDSECPP